jgi:tetratricopeptide (TPR) repeat protein
MSIDMGRKAGFPEIFNLHALRGDALNKAGRYQEALEEFTSAIDLYPYPGYFYHRGLALKGLGRMKEAEADFQRAGNLRGPIEWRKKN